MNIREAHVLIRLYETHPDKAMRDWAVRQVPELGYVAVVAGTKVYKLTAYVDGYSIGNKRVICASHDLETYRQDFRRDFDLATNVLVVAEEVK